MSSRLFLFKHSMLLILITFCSVTAFGQKRDTAIFYFRNQGQDYYKVNTPDSADFIRMIIPPDDADNRLNVVEYYRNGNMKLIGKSEPYLPGTFATGDISLDGECVQYYLNGKKRNISEYKQGKKTGLEYAYNYNGGIYCVLKHTFEGSYMLPETLYWDCYDLKGKQICKGGNGWWIFYNENMGIQFQGPVKDGFQDGKWEGKAKVLDTVKYTCIFKSGKFISGVGYDKAGNSYPFSEAEVDPSYNEENPISFVRILRDYFRMPKNAGDRKRDLDTAHFSFIIEKDNSISHVSFLSPSDSVFTKSLVTAFEKCRNWTTTKFYGVPFRTRIIFPFRESGEVVNGPITMHGAEVGYLRKMYYKAEVVP